VTSAQLQSSLPNLVIAGVTKAGTTSLFRYLAQHPEVFPADVKELRYFSPLRHGQPLEPIESYAAHFAGRRGERYAMEATPGYYYGGAALASAMVDTLPGVRVVVSFRDPVDRCRSWFNFMRSRARLEQDLPFDEYVERCLERHADGTDDTVEAQPYWGVGGGCYDRWIDAWCDALPGRFRVVFFEQLAAAPAAVTADLLSWLEIDDRPAHSFRYDVENKTEQFRVAWLQRGALVLNRGGGRFFGRHPAAKRRLRRAYYLLNRRAEPVAAADAAVERLREFYAPHNARLAADLRERLGIMVLPRWLTADQD
jgi:hypothetical protein